MDTTEVPQFQPLTQNLRSNVCVIGAGIAGMTTAYLLARAGRAVVLIDDGPIGGGETSRTTAHLTAALDDRYYNIEKMHGEEGARLAAESHMAAIHRIETIASMEDIDCDFQRVEGFLFLGGESSKRPSAPEYPIHSWSIASRSNSGTADPRSAFLDRPPFIRSST
jgi:hypothetical protein